MTPRDIFVRAVKTAAQSFLAVLVAAGTDYVNVATIRAAAIAAGAAAISALYNALAQGRGEETPLFDLQQTLRHPNPQTRSRQAGRDSPLRVLRRAKGTTPQPPRQPQVTSVSLADGNVAPMAPHVDYVAERKLDERYRPLWCPLCLLDVVQDELHACPAGGLHPDGGYVEPGEKIWVRRRHFNT